MTTDWFPHEIKPVRSGWYDTLNVKTGVIDQQFRWWFDVATGNWKSDVDGFVCQGQNRSWRGRTKP
jgi:hypothetical protein